MRKENSLKDGLINLASQVARIFTVYVQLSNVSMSLDSYPLNCHHFQMVGLDVKYNGFISF